MFICVHLWIIFLFSCQSKPTDLRTLAPAETIIYLETNDLGKTLESLTETKAFEEFAKEKTDFSALENVQFAVAVTGFETSEQELFSERSELNFKPRFVAIADTHAWNFNAVSLAENQIGRLARQTYGENVKFEKSEKAGAKFFVWTSAADGRKIFAAVSGGVIYVGNDENLIDKCLDVGRGKAESLLKNENLARARENTSSENQIAFGYVSGEGVAQIANLAGVSAAVNTTENEDGRSFIARILPQILQKTTKEISWTASKTEQGIEDKIFVATTAEVASVLKETLQTSTQPPTNAAEFLPAAVFSATRYDLKNPQIAWRGLLLTIAKQTDPMSGRFLAEFSNSLLAPFGIADADTFLSRVDSEIFTAKLDDAGEKSIAVAAVKDLDAVKKSIAEIDFKSQPEKFENAEIWQSETGEFAAAFVENKLILGERESVFECLQAKNSGRNFTKSQYFQKFAESKASAVTFAKDADSTKKIVEVLGETKDGNTKINFISLTETRFTEKGIERKTVSAFGLIGSILERLKD
ncbi:MAG: hypothetical protein M3525_10835 [Acidobacteriota bacterium]|nr:hypothetical protein [Acidobacteriota bacterium]